MKSYEYHTCCVNSTGELINAMIDSAVDITYKTFMKHCKDVNEWASSMSYDLDSRKGLTLKDDWHVSYHKSIYDGLPCYYIRHSAIEHIWVENNWVDIPITFVETE